VAEHREGLRIAVKPRPSKSDAAFGPVCDCGRPKAKQAWTCQPCHSRLRGYGTVPLVEQNRLWRRSYLGGVRTVGDEDQALIERDRALTEARNTAAGELAAVVADQQLDERIGHLARDRWMVPLDSTDRYGRPLHELFAEEQTA
jgi:hypothetical protein